MRLFENEERSWKLYLKAIETIVGGDQSPESEVFQPLAVLQQVDFDNQNAPFFNYFRQYMFANMMPRWGGLGVPSGSSFTQIFGDFLNRLIDVISQDQTTIGELTVEEERAIERQKIFYENAEKEAAYYNSRAEQAWIDYYRVNADNPMRDSKDEFLQRNTDHILATGWERKEHSATYNILRILTRIDADMQLVNGVHENFFSDLYKERYPEKIEWEQMQNKWIKVLKQGVGVDIFRFKKGSNNQGFSIDSASTESTTISTRWGGTLGVRRGIFSFKGSFEATRLEEEAYQKSTSVSLGFEHFGEFPLERSEWFSKYIIDRFGALLPEFWGPRGYLSVIPTSVVLAKGISINIVTDETHTSKAETHFRAGGSIGFGPFNFGGGNYRDYIHSSFENRGNNFSIRSTNDDVYVIGYRCATPHAVETTRYYSDMRKALLKL